MGEREIMNNGTWEIGESDKGSNGKTGNRKMETRETGKQEKVKVGGETCVRNAPHSHAEPQYTSR